MPPRKPTPSDDQAQDQTPPPADDDIPVFAPAEEPTPDAERVYDIPAWLAENYDELIADPNRNDSYTALAERSAAEGAHELAGWARQRAAAHGEDVTPVAATPSEGQSTRGDGDQ